MQQSIKLPKRLHQLEWYPSANHGLTRRFTVAPLLLVLHSAETDPGVAEFCHKHEGRIKQDGSLTRICYHVAYSAVKGDYVQQIEFDREGWHCAGSKWLVMPGKRINPISIAVAMPGPYNAERSEDLLERTVNLAHLLKREIPSLEYWVKHSEINRFKKDPGKYTPSNLLDGIFQKG